MSIAYFKHHLLKMGSDYMIYLIRIFGAYSPIMFALRYVFKLVSLGGNCMFQFQITSIMFRRTYGIVFERTLFEDCVRKNILQYIQKDSFQNI